ncbi:MAG: ribonuclease Z [Clostridia bacterium]|nr:ribonuclease Z [Clostridia bacterium]
MKITFLGSSHGVPEKERYCSSAMIEAGEKTYLIDAGAPITDLLLRRGKKLEEIVAIFTTHSHSDHTFGLIPFLDLANWYYKNTKTVTYFTGEALMEQIPLVIESASNHTVFDRERLQLKLAHEGRVYEDDTVRITYIPVQHMTPSYAILLEAEGKRVLFTGDLSGMLKKEDFPKVGLEEETDVIICEMAHFGPDEIRPYMEKAKTKQWWFNHVNRTATGEKFKAIEEMAGDFAYPVYIAHDNDEILL